MITTVMLLGCRAVPFQNDPPYLERLNGFEVTKRTRHIQTDIPFTPGESVEIELEAVDPEGDGILVHWGWAPPGWEFEPEATRGVWEVPADYVDYPAPTLFLTDDHRKNPRTRVYYLTFANTTWDTGHRADTGISRRPETPW